jgi:3-oxoacyl-[acyl-carrier protein] reductase
LGKMEAALNECAKHGLLKPCNVRLTANLIKSMLDAWVLKRWDLRGIVSRREAEQAMMDLILNGLLKDQGKILPAATKAHKSNCALIVNGGTMLSKALSVFLVQKGLKVIIYIDRIEKNCENLSGELESIGLYSADKDGPLGPELFERIERENGPVNIFIQDMGAGNTALSGLKAAKNKSGGGLYKDFLNAYKSSEYLCKTMVQRAYGRIVFMAPWAWDYYQDSIQYEIVKSATVAMTRALSRDLAPAGVNVNCIVPGFIKSTKPSPLEKKFSDKVAESIPSRHLGEIQDILDAVWFLVSNGSDFITGEVLNITGGG